MNEPPDEFVTVAPDILRQFVTAVLESVCVPPDRAAFLSDCLVQNDLRGVFSHGTKLLARYAPDFRAGRLNPNPVIGVTAETATTLTVDGDGGLGYYPAYRAATLIGPKALEMGVAVALTKNHGHIGAAGIYSRVPLKEHDLFCYVTSGSQLDLRPGGNVLSAGGGSPMSFALPTGEEPPFVLDFGTMNELYPGSPHVEEMIAIAPGTVYRSIGLGSVCQALGGFLAGVPVDPECAERRWEGANQGSFLIAVDLKRFGSLDAFKREMDEYARKVRQLKPLQERHPAALAGELEWQRERRYAAEGIPVGPTHRETLRNVATKFGIDAPI
jgi:L-2-hydroxycarboxylate dehydrogenase (NAD+)